MKESYEATLEVNNAPIELNPFVEKVLARTVVGAVSSLKGAEGIESLELHLEHGDVRLIVNVRYHRDNVDRVASLCTWYAVNVDTLDVGCHDGRVFHVIYGEMGTALKCCNRRGMDGYPFRERLRRQGSPSCIYDHGADYAGRIHRLRVPGYR